MLRKTIFTMIGLLTLTVAAAAHADADTYPGMMCDAYSGTVDTDAYGHSQNESSSSWAYVICPVVADPLVSSGSETIKMWVTDYNSDYNICCRPVAKNVGTTVSGSWVCTSGSSSSYKTLTFSNIPNMSYSYSHRYFQCQIPPTDDGTSEIRSYRWWD